jgi:hypothetical protein
MWRSARSTGAPRAQRAVRGRLLVLACTLSVAVDSGACTPDFEKLTDQRSPRGTLGEEVYKTLCRRVAGTELPADIEGRQSEVLCLGQATEVDDELVERRAELPARLVALADRRAQLVRAVDDLLPDELGDELELLMRELLPFYDPPEERLQNGTRSFATLLQRLAADPAALEGLETIARDGMSSREGAFGIYRAFLGYDRLNTLFSSVLPVLTRDPAVQPYFKTMLEGMALEMATSELDDEPGSDTLRMKDLLSRSRPELGSGRPLFVVLRDKRGFPVPTPVAGQVVPFPFVDADGDQLADVRDAEFVVQASLGRDLPEPFPEVSESGVERDAYGRAYGLNADGSVNRDRTLYATRDADPSVLSAALKEAAKLFDEQNQTAVHVARLVPALFGTRKERVEPYGAAAYGYSAPDVNQSPAVDLAHASSVLLDRPLYEQSLELTQRLLDEHEGLLTEALDPLLTLERRTRAASDAYPKAELSEGSVFWDELLFELERMSRRRKTQDGPTLVELLLRGALGYARNLEKEGGPVEQVMSPEVLKHQGALIATLMRFKDEWRNNPKGESERAAGDPATIGSFRTPVDRSKPDSPVTCGKDGCGGLMAGSPFERWARPGQTCVLQRDRRDGTDCGAPANQSILHRSMGLIWEMAGRSQCNKPITIGDLLDFAAFEDPCQNLQASLCGPANGDCACGSSGQSESEANQTCVGLFGSSDYSCDRVAARCIAKPSSTTCGVLKQEQRLDRQKQIEQAEERVALDYACPADKPTAACHAFEQKWPAAFVKIGDQPSTLQACGLLDLPDVGRSFGRALTHEFLIKVPNPWVLRYLEDVARAGDPSIPDCLNTDDILDPREVPMTTNGTADPSDDEECIPSSAGLSRDVYKDMSPEIDTLGELIEFLLDDSSLFTNQKDLEELRPNVSALTRVLFAPPGSSSFIMFDPLVVLGAPAACNASPVGTPECAADDTAATPAGGCCIKDLKNPPFRYRLDTYYGTTSFAWEYPLRFSDGSSLSLLEAMKGLADGVNRTDYDADTGDDPKNFEGTDFLFSTLGKVVGQHYDSPANLFVQNKDPKAPHFRNLSNLVSYEELLADALDDGTLDRAQQAPHGEPLFDDRTLPSTPERTLGLVLHSYPLLQMFDAQKPADAGGGPVFSIAGTDAISFTAKLSELLLSPHASCAPEGGDLRVIDGKGACDLLAPGVDSPGVCDAQAQRPQGFRKPLTYRDGRATICWNDGTCLNQPNACHYASPLYLALDALSAVDDRIGDSEKLETAFQGARAGLFEAYLKIDDGRLADRRLHALALVGLSYMRERWAEEAALGTLSSLGPEMLQDTVDLIQSPVFAGSLGVMEGLGANSDAISNLNRFVGASLGGLANDDGMRALCSSMSELLEALPGDDNLLALTKAMAQGLAPNVTEVVQSGGDLAFDQGMIWRNLDLLRDISLEDKESVLGRVLNNAVALPAAGTPQERAAPMSELYDLLLAINRPEPGAHGNLSSRDFHHVFELMAEVLLDERRGFERLYQIVQCRNGSTEELSCQ